MVYVVYTIAVILGAVIGWFASPDESFRQLSMVIGEIFMLVSAFWLRHYE